MVRRNRAGYLQFSDFPEFCPRYTPREMFQMGVFGGTYWRPIRSGVTKKQYRDAHLEFPKSWWKGIDEKMLTSCRCSKARNYYGATSGTSLAYWEERGWITAQDPYGWVQWYCRFYRGRRTEDDRRQIDRWMGVASVESGRFRRMRDRRARKGHDVSVLNQLLLQWAMN